MRTGRNPTKQLAAAMVCGLVLCAAPVFAQDNGNGNGTAPAATQDQTAPMHHAGGDRQEHRIEHMTKALNLTPDQVAQVKAIDASAQDQMRALHGDTSLAPADKHAKMMSIRQDSMTKVRDLLSDEQKSKFDAMQARMKERREEHHGEQEAPAAPPAQ